VKTFALTLCVVVAFTVPAVADQWERQGSNFVLTVDQEQITYAPPGTISVGTNGEVGIRVAIFLWHDNWVYERLDGGQVSSGPELDERGWIRQAGTWVVREQASPMKYALAIEPTATGAVVHLETEKTAALNLTSGLWCALSLDRQAFSGRRVYARPTAHGPVGTAVSGGCDALLIELADGKAAAFSGEGLFEDPRSVAE